ncbi:MULTISPECIES: hypothetical protein [Cellulomonas]|uniref:Heme exporter protein D n=1 Tax=Cellulomonas iranensis TaxID=76862 RepID=A0ABU0GJ30_9CELL|nr:MULTISPECIES: hypothetical protein [Cellulomonas]MDQ0425387.1 heme exporter protein D [Cellulomonas iranensis]TFH71090.1 hypothetical protein E4A51_09525 [Cellulomonas sp. HD19AZ1]
MDPVLWFVWVALLAVVVGGTATVVDTVLKHRRRLAEIRADAARRDVHDRLDAVDARIERLERASDAAPR